MTYERFFSLSRRPFSVHPDPSSYFALPRHQQIVSTLRDCVEHIEGIGLLVGDAGLGKTLLGTLLVQELQSRLQGILLGHSNLPSKRALLQAILFELRQPYAGMDEQEARLALVNYLRSRSLMQPALLLVVDEAHGLQPELLEELRLLTNWTLGVKPLVRLVLAGQPILEELLAGPDTDLLNQRIARRVFLSPLTGEETAHYVTHRLRWAGAEASSIFTAEALQAIHRSADGVPRTINLLCDQVLLLAAERRTAPVPAAVVKEAWGELEQLPTNWDYAGDSPGEGRPAATGVVEFGSPEDTGIGPDTAFAEANATNKDINAFESAGRGAHRGTAMPRDQRSAQESEVLASFCAIGEAASLEPQAPSEPAEVACIAAPPQVENDPHWVLPDQAAGECLNATAQQPHEQLSSPATLPETGGGSGPAAPVHRLSAEQPAAGAHFRSDAKLIDPSPLDAPFEEEEQVSDRYATLDAQLCLVSKSAQSEEFALHAVAGGRPVNGTARPACQNTPRPSDSSASPRSDSSDYRRLFSALRK